MSGGLSPVALAALKAAQSVMTPTEVDLHGDVVASALAVVDGEGRLVGARSAEELLRLRARVAELEQELAALKAQGLVLRARPADGITRRIAPTQALRETDGEHYAAVHHDYRRGRDLPTPHTATAEAHAQMRAHLTRHFAGDDGACRACGDVPEKWCPDCAACEAGCFGGHDGNPCTHANASWGA